MNLFLAFKIENEKSQTGFCLFLYFGNIPAKCNGKKKKSKFYLLFLQFMKYELNLLCETKT